MSHVHHHQTINGNGSNPCTDKLSDIEYLEHMIPHHQVAVDMSNLLIPYTTNPTMLHLCRDIIRKQKYEIWEMNVMLKSIPDNISSYEDMNLDIINFKTKLEKHNPTLSKSKDGDCNPLFFKPNDHAAHMEGMLINDRSYLEHMIPHHQVAIDMSRRLLMHTNNDYLINFCRKLIIDQQAEIYLMNNLLHNLFNYESVLLNNMY